MPEWSLRQATRWLLSLAVLISGLSAWQLLTDADDRLDELTRHVRGDAWAARQARGHASGFLLELAHDVIGGRATAPDDRVRASADAPSSQGTETPAERTSGQEERQSSGERVRASFDRLAQAVAALASSETGEVGAAINPVGVATTFETALAPIKAWLDGPLEPAVLRRIQHRLSAPLAGLDQLITDLENLRAELQNRDWARADRLIRLNRYIVVGFLLGASLVIALLVIEARNAERARRAALGNEQRFRDFAEIASDWMWETDADFRFTGVTNQIAETAGFDAESCLGRTLWDLVPEALEQPELAEMQALIERRQPFRDVVCRVGQSREEEGHAIVRVSGTPYFDRRGVFHGYRGVGTDISTEVRRESRIRFLAEHDQLTHLPNRASFQDHIRQILASKRSIDRKGVLYALDLDGFKDVNDTFGHDVGDGLIIAVAERLGRCVRPGDMIARLGGDEFMVVQRLDGPAVEDPGRTAERLIQALARPFQVAGREFSVGTSIGIACFPEDGTSLEELMKAADLALYAAKEAGRGRAVAFNPVMTRDLQMKKRLEADLRHALEADRLQLYLQPQVDLASQAVVGSEALVRWHHDELGWIGADVFVGVAEQTGLILPLGRWVLETACREAAGWADLDPQQVLAVNVSPAQFMHQDLVKEVTEVLESTGLAPERLELEITEGLLMRDEELAIRTLDRLHEMGVQLAIDDFGTGYSSLSYLRHFRVHKLKIDRSFVIDLERNADDRTIVRAIIGLGQALGLSTIAEGVETPAQAEILTCLGCNQGQGYLFGKPAPATRFVSEVLAPDAA
jgi:diguanylate cyclase (GGDEF)-like protein/PAS domain S-box-containing protein